MLQCSRISRLTNSQQYRLCARIGIPKAEHPQLLTTPRRPPNPQSHPPRPARPAALFRRVTYLQPLGPIASTCSSRRSAQKEQCPLFPQQKPLISAPEPNQPFSNGPVLPEAFTRQIRWAIFLISQLLNQQCFILLLFSLLKGKV